MDHSESHISHSEEEYQFPGFDSGAVGGEGRDSAQEPDIPSKRAVFERIGRSHIVIACLLIGLGLGGWQLFNTLKSARLRSTAQLPTEARLSPPVAQLPAKSIAAPVVSLPAASRPLAAVLDEEVRRLEAARQASVEESARRWTTAANQLTEVQAGLDRFGSQLDALQGHLVQLDDRLSRLSAQVAPISQAYQQQRAREIAERRRIAQRRAQQELSPKPIYSVRALIPGRAWLSTGDGAILTIGAGDRVPGYGIVQDIDIQQGVVRFSAGGIIGFSPEDG